MSDGTLGPGDVCLERPSAQRCEEFLAAVARSAALHGRFAAPPSTQEAYEGLLRRARSISTLSYFVCTRDGQLAGVININEIVRGAFQSGYLGYYAFAPHAGRGHMRAGLQAVLAGAFGPHSLHRLEANIQPDNQRSIALVKSLGFRREGYSPRYLHLAGAWRDHERWAICADD
jgi:ribosomal-protein-alanine N-acetyltransferase